LTHEGDSLRTCCLALVLSSSSQTWTPLAAAQTAVAPTIPAQTAAAQTTAAQTAAEPTVSAPIDAEPTAATPTVAEPEYREPLVDVHAFVSQGFIKSTANEFLAKSQRGSFEFSEVGVNLTRALGQNLRVGMQLFTRDIGRIGNYGARFDWFGLDYHFFDWLGVRAGRTKLPYGLYNETSDVDAARVPVLLPQSVYSTTNRDFLLAQTGVELYGYVPIGDLGAFDYRLYGGTLYLDLGDTSTNRTSITDIPYLIGGRLMWMTPLSGLQLGGTVQALRLDGTYTPTGADDPTLARLAARGLIRAGYAGPILFEVPALLWLASVEYTLGEMTLASEYGRTWSDTDVIEPERTSTAANTSESFYVMASYRVAEWLQPGLYYSVLFSNIKDRRGRDAYQHDVALTLRFDLTQFWILKAETHYMHGTAALDVALNEGTPRTELEKDWGVLLLKTTAYF
jgi:hypothetical protein